MNAYISNILHYCLQLRLVHVDFSIKSVSLSIFSMHQNMHILSEAQPGSAFSTCLMFFVSFPPGEPPVWSLKCGSLIHVDVCQDGVADYWQNFYLYTL